MHTATLTKPDGRRLRLYARAPLRVDGPAPVPDAGRITGVPHLRWHPLREEWVAYAPYRQERTFLPPAEFDPLAPTRTVDQPTELPGGNWEIAVFDNRFPTLVADAGDPPASIVATSGGAGACEVVVFTQEASGALGLLPLAHLELLLDVWAERTSELGARPDIAYVMPFENRGVEVGVTLQHPHGQIYAYGFIPPLPARELAAEQRYFAAHGRALLADHLAAEQADGARLLYSGPHAIACVPACARYPFEAWIAPRRAAPALAALSSDERRDLARALKTVLLQFDGLWQQPFPYIMVLHQAPTDGAPHPESHLHFELYPAYRSRGRLKYLAGTEVGAGMFANDVLPETAAAELRKVEVHLS